MSIPAFAWALEEGRTRNLPTSERMLLVVIADRGNGHRACYAGQACLAKDTGLKERQVRISLRRLEAEGLIRIERDGKSRLYHVLRPNGLDHSPTPAQNAGNGHAKPARNAGVQRTTPAQNAPTPAQNAENTGTECRQTLREPRKEPKTRASRSEPAATSQRSDGALAAAPSQPPNQNGTPPPVVSEEAPAAPDAVRSLVAGVTSALRVASPPRAVPPEPDIPIRRGPVDAIRTVEQQQAQLAVWIAQEAAANAARLQGAAL